MDYQQHGVSPEGTDVHPNNTCDSGRASLPASLHQQCNKTNRHLSSAGQNQSPPATTSTSKCKALKKTFTASRKSQKVESKQPRTRPPCPFGCGKTFNRPFDSQRHADTSNSCGSRGKLSQAIACPRCHTRISTRPDAVRRHLRTKHGLSARAAKKAVAKATSILPVTIMPTSVNRGIIRLIF
jgi:hypothetical protein